MQTFLPYPSFTKSAKCLDRMRLGKQRVECLQILNALLSPGTSRWENHPAVKMWRGYEEALCVYGMCICADWIGRGYADTCFGKIQALAPGSRTLVGKAGVLPDDIVPWWYGDHRLHASHRSNLLRKDKNWYGKFGWKETDDIPYFWPTASP